MFSRIFGTGGGSPSAEKSQPATPNTQENPNEEGNPPLENTTLEENSPASGTAEEHPAALRVLSRSTVKRRGSDSNAQNRTKPGLYEPSPGLLGGEGEPHSAKILWVKNHGDTTTGDDSIKICKSSEDSEVVRSLSSANNQTSNRGKQAEHPGGTDPPPVSPTREAARTCHIPSLSS